MKFLPILLLVSSALTAQNYQQYVNPMIGTGGHGHTYPGATVPFGMVQLSPDTRIDGSWDGCSGYHYSDAVIYGFSHTHLNGAGVSDFGDIMLMPTMGEPSLDNKEYSSKFSHENENASAGYYGVKLDKYNIDVDLTASPRVGFHEYKFNYSGQANVILDLNHRDKLLQGEVRIIDSKTIEVLRRSEAWARDQYVYARIEFSRPMEITKVSNNAFAPAKTTDKFFAGSVLALSFSSRVKYGDKIMVKVALSPTGYEGAKLNMTEVSHWNFYKVKDDAEYLWKKELSKIEIKESDADKLAVFYTALYHTMVQPNIAQDIDGKYRGRDQQIHQVEGFDYYSVFSLWDTFRAAHPLYTLIDKKRAADFINTFLKQYEQGGRLPVWELASNETDCMIGYHSVSVIADAMAKDIRGFDYEKAYEAAKNSAMQDHLGLKAYQRNGFISIDDEHESVSKTVEYAYDDWCIAQMALQLGKTDDYNYFITRSQSWKNLFDPEIGHMRPRKNGGWDKPFDPREVNNNFTEGNSWHYTFFVPHDIPGLVNAYGGSDQFESKLDEMFTAISSTTGREQVDITGLIGQYAHGNEPSHHMAYLYNHIGKPEKTDTKIKYILDNFYKNSPDGLIGNEDCGQMSAWYVLSSMGIYPVTPGIPEWTTTKPYFSKIKVNLENGATERIAANSKTPANFGFPNGNIIKHNVQNTPTYIPSPVINATSATFGDSQPIDLTALKSDSQTYYSVSEPGSNSPQIFLPFEKPFTITQSSIVTAYSQYQDGQKSNSVTAKFFKKPNDFSINIESKYNPQYHAGGTQGLLDGILGDENWRKGNWQGYQGQNFVATIDLQRKKTISSIKMTFLQDSRSWILFPVKVEYYVSNDNKNFSYLKTAVKSVDALSEVISISDLGANFEPTQARYIKVFAFNYGLLPKGHQGAGGEAFIFVDEITIE